jgi:Ca2+-binding EF-hand superfamily protein
MVDKKSPDELLEEVEIHSVEQVALDRVYRTFLSMADSPSHDKFGVDEVTKILKHLGVPQSRPDVELILWEVDEDLDGAVSKNEFEIMYKRCVSDKTGLEPRKLFNLV